MLNRYENTNRASRTGDACDETSPLERKNHLMNGGRRHPEEPLHVGLSWRQTVHKGVGANERKVLTLQLRESLAVIAHAQGATTSPLKGARLYARPFERAVTPRSLTSLTSTR